MKTVHPEHRCQRLCLQDVRGEAVGNKDRRDTVHVERVTRKEAPDTPRPLVSGQSSGGCGGGRGEAGPRAVEAPPHVPVCRWGRCFTHLLSVDRCSQVLLISCVLLALCPTPQRPLVSVKEFLCPEGKHISCVSEFRGPVALDSRVPWQGIRVHQGQTTAGLGLEYPLDSLRETRISGTLTALSMAGFTEVT